MVAKPMCSNNLPLKMIHFYTELHNNLNEIAPIQANTAMTGLL